MVGGRPDRFPASLERRKWVGETDWRGGPEANRMFFQLLHWVELQTKVMHVFVDVGKYIT